jgi:hypothetical protein
MEAVEAAQTNGANANEVACEPATAIRTFREPPARLPIPPADRATLPADRRPPSAGEGRGTAWCDRTATSPRIRRPGSSRSAGSLAAQRLKPEL